MATSLKQRVANRHGRWAASDSAGALYRAFYADPDRQELFKPLGRKKIEFADVFPLVYTMIATSRQQS